MSTNELISAACEGKAGYASYGEAAGVLKRRSRRKERIARRLDVYRCRFCQRFHIGNKKQRRAHRRRPDDDAPRA